MHEDRSTEFELSKLEGQLRKLAPVEPGLNHVRLMFLAGQASVQPRRQMFWPAVSGILAVSLCAVSVYRIPDPRIPPQIVENDSPVQVDTDAAGGWRPKSDALGVIVHDADRPTSLAMRRVALRHGVDALPRFVPATSKRGNAPTTRELLWEIAPQIRRDAEVPTTSSLWNWQQILSNGDTT